MAPQSVGLQVAVALILACLAYGTGGDFRQVAAVFCGGLVSSLNGAMLAWRMFQALSRSTQEAFHPDEATRQLRLLYFYAAERFLVVVVLLGLCIAFFKGSELAVLGGFVVGQTAMLAARLFLNR